jgi:hypothetical protein
MPNLRYTLVSEGSSDKALIPILTWLLYKNGVTRAIQEQWADLGEIRIHEPMSLRIKIREGVRLYDCDLLFIHRDADNVPIETRQQEIAGALADLTVPPCVCVIPVRMQEAWLLFDEMAIRWAAGNPNGTVPLALPPLRRLESLPDPKIILHELLKTASEYSGRRKQRFKPAEKVRLVSQYSEEDFSPLRSLTAFATLESSISQAVREQGWNT